MAEQAVCQICGSNSGKYVCPKCNMFYCSLRCYKSEKHLECSEAFYEKCVLDELKDKHTDDEDKRKILEILKKQNQETDSEESLDSDDDAGSEDLATRMLDVNLDDEEAVWEKLTAEEKQEFRKLVANGSIIQVLPENEPWWKTKKRKTLIQDLEENTVDSKTLVPAVPLNIPKLSTLTKSKPSDNMVFIVLNVLESYVFTVRWFKGGAHQDLPVEALSTIVALSATLRNNEIFTDPVQAFIAFENDLSKCEWIKSEEYNKNLLLEDLSDIITGSDPDDPYLCLKAVFSDIDTLCSKAVFTLKDCKTNHLKRFSGSPPKLSDIKKISKKMTFFLSWTVEYGFLLKNVLMTFT